MNRSGRAFRAFPVNRVGTLAMGLAAACVLAVLLAGCGGRIEKAGRPQADAAGGVATDSLKVSLTLNAGSFAVGEQIVMRLAAVNVSGRTLSLTFPTTGRSDFVVRRAGKIVWQLSSGLMFAQVLNRVTLAAGDSLVYAANWDQRLGDGTNASLGAYTIQGILKTAPEITTPERPFGIVD